MTNFFDIDTLGFTEESFTTFFETSDLKIERIITRGQVSPKDFYYDQDEDEWVLLLSGEAVLLYEKGEKVILKKGDSIFIPAHTKHRVEEVSTLALWLVIFVKKKEPTE